MTACVDKLRRQELDGRDWYEVQVEGYFEPGWFSWMDGWEITPLPNGNSLLSGPVADQPALHGIFAYIRDINVKIIGLRKIKP